MSISAKQLAELEDLVTQLRAQLAQALSAALDKRSEINELIRLIRSTDFRLQQQLAATRRSVELPLDQHTDEVLAQAFEGLLNLVNLILTPSASAGGSKAQVGAAQPGAGRKKGRDKPATAIATTPGRRRGEAKPKGINAPVGVMLNRSFASNDLPTDVVEAIKVAFPDSWQTKPITRWVNGGGQLTRLWVDDVKLVDSWILHDLRHAARLLRDAAAKQPTNQQVQKLYEDMTRHYSWETIKRTLQAWGITF